eukprot:12408283-Karenia_brevis.AAC.1
MLNATEDGEEVNIFAAFPDEDVDVPLLRRNSSPTLYHAITPNGEEIPMELMAFIQWYGMDATPAQRMTLRRYYAY